MPDLDFAVKHYKNRISKKAVPPVLTLQQHHDLYVKKYKESLASGTRMTEAEFYEYMLAMKREREGLVKG